MIPACYTYNKLSREGRQRLSEAVQRSIWIRTAQGADRRQKDEKETAVKMEYDHNTGGGLVYAAGDPVSDHLLYCGKPDQPPVGENHCGFCRQGGGDLPDAHQ